MHLYRPYGVVMNGELVVGVELLVEGGVIHEIRPHTGIPDAYVISPAFINAHSHFEYRGMLNKILEPRYFEWIWELTRLKTLETPEYVQDMCDLAARENRATGVALVGEHSDRIGSARAMVEHGLGGWIFQEMLDGFDHEPSKRFEIVLEKFRENQAIFEDVSISPHAFHTVREKAMTSIAEATDPISIHVCETPLEDAYVRDGKGQIAELRTQLGIDVTVTGFGVVESLDRAGILARRTQCVHVCSVNPEEIALLASRKVSIAHCPRSNTRLQCPTAPVREFLDSGLNIGIGMDSPASGGEINMFAEMAEAHRVSYERGKVVRPEEIWRMATTMGYQSFGRPGREAWDIYEGSSTPLIEIHCPGALSVEHLMDHASPEDVRWLS